jgi:hypothetical protein
VEVASPSKGSTEVVIIDRLNIDEHFNSTQCVICGDLAIQGTLVVSDGNLSNVVQVFAMTVFLIGRRL